MSAELHLAENTLALHLLFQRLEGLIDIVVANEEPAPGILFQLIDWILRKQRTAKTPDPSLKRADVPDQTRNVHQQVLPNQRLLAGSRGFGRPGTDLRHMPHFPARSRWPLAIEVHGRAWNRQPLFVAVDLVPDQVGHGDRAMSDRLAERPSGNGADMLLELRDRRAVQRPNAPELCTRGAISLTRTFGPRSPCTTNISTASTPT